jgi:hypothetical protein
MLPGVRGVSPMEFNFRGWVSGLLERREPKPYTQIKLKHVGAPQPSPYRAVSVRPGPVSCQAAKQFGNLRFFLRKAPRLPLPECNCESCNCSYVHHADRRRGYDRRETLESSPAAAIVERRLRSGRRSTEAKGFNDPLATR